MKRNTWMFIEIGENNVFQKKAVQLLVSFLAFAAVLTIVSRVADATAMARIKTKKVWSGSVNYSVEVNGNIEAKGILPIFTEAGLLVKDVEVEEGMKVEKGTILFSIDLEELEENIRLLNKEKKKLQLQMEDLNNSMSNLEKQRDLDISRALEDQQDTENKWIDTVNIALQEFENAKANLQEHISHPYSNQAKKEWEEKKKVLDKKVKEKQKNYDKAAKSKDEQESEKALKELKKAEEEQAEHLLTPVEEETKQEWEEKKKLLEDMVTEKEKIYYETTKEKGEASKLADRQIDDASKQIEHDNSTVYFEMEIEEIDRKCEKLEKVKAEKGEIKAEKEGNVNQINIEAGGKTTESPLMILSDASKGYQFTGFITEQQKEVLALDDFVKIIPSYEKVGELAENLPGRKIDAIQSDEESGGYKIIVQIEEGGIDKGGSAMLLAEKTGQDYGSCVPLTALHNQDGAVVVYTIREKATVLGVQNVLEKVEVNIIAQDQTQALVEGNLSIGSNVVIESSKPIKSGDRVRLLEE